MTAWAVIDGTPPTLVATAEVWRQPTTTIGVEPIGAELRRYLTDRQRRAADLHPMRAVVARVPGDRPAVLGVGRDRTRLDRAAAELALTYAAVLVSSPPVVPLPWRVGDRAACLTCQADVVLTVAEVSGRRVPYWQHVEPAEHSDPQAHAARVAVTS